MSSATRKLCGPLRIDSSGASTRSIELSPNCIGPRVHELVFFLKVLAWKDNKTKLGLNLAHGPDSSITTYHSAPIALAVPSTPSSVMAGSTDTPTNGQLAPWVVPLVRCGQAAGGSGDQWAVVELYVVVKRL
jgi:hypothetical protein